jgi:hypothetical protein
MKKINFTLALAALLIYFSSCTIEKRTFNKGYFVQWNSKKVTQKSNQDDLLVKTDGEIIENTSFTSEKNTESNENLSEVQTSVSDNISNSDVLINEKSKSAVRSTPTNPNLKTKTSNLSLTKKIKQIAQVKNSIKKVAPPMDGESILNIVLLVVFLGLAILFTMLALKAIMPMIIVWGVLALVSFILFITQIFDVFL